MFQTPEINELKIQIIVLIVISTLVMILLYKNKGTVDHTLSMCESLNIYAPPKCDWWGPIFALSLNLGEDWGRTFNLQWLFSYIHDDYKTYIGFLIYIIYSLVPIYFFIRVIKLKNNIFIKNKKTFINILILVFLFSLPLFHLAQDWSRWFSIHYHLLAFLLFFLQQRKFINFQNNIKFIKLDKIFNTDKIRKYFFITLFLYATSVHHHHFFLKGVRLEFTYYKVFK